MGGPAAVNPHRQRQSRQGAPPAPSPFVGRRPAKRASLRVGAFLPGFGRATAIGG